MTAKARAVQLTYVIIHNETIIIQNLKKLHKILYKIKQEQKIVKILQGKELRHWKSRGVAGKIETVQTSGITHFICKM